MNDNETKMKITIENRDRKLTWESPYVDTPMEEILEAIYGMCITMTWHPYTVLSNMYEFSKEGLKSLSDIDINDDEMICD